MFVDQHIWIHLRANVYIGPKKSTLIIEFLKPIGTFFLKTIERTLNENVKRVKTSSTIFLKFKIDTGFTRIESRKKY